MRVPSAHKPRAGGAACACGWVRPDNADPAESYVAHLAAVADEAPELADARQSVALAWSALCGASFDLANAVNAGAEGPALVRAETALRAAAVHYGATVDAATAAARRPRRRR